LTDYLHLTLTKLATAYNHIPSHNSRETRQRKENRGIEQTELQANVISTAFLSFLKDRDGLSHGFAEERHGSLMTREAIKQ
jgi:hypothetical protein